MSGESAEYRKNEKERSLRYYYEKKASRTGHEGLKGLISYQMRTLKGMMMSIENP